MAKTPIELANKWEQTYGDKVKTPLDEFKNYEGFITTGPDFFENEKHYGAPLRGFGAKYETPYPKLLEAYSKSKGKFAGSAFTDPEIQKYFQSRLAERDALYNRVRKVPKEKWVELLNDYGSFSDPFDYEGEPVESASQEDIEKFIEGFDYDYGDWETLDQYLKEKGY